MEIGTVLTYLATAISVIGTGLVVKVLSKMVDDHWGNRYAIAEHIWRKIELPFLISGPALLVVSLWMGDPTISRFEMTSGFIIAILTADSLARRKDWRMLDLMRLVMERPPGEH